MLNNIHRASAETTTSAERASQRADNHIDLGGINILRFCNTAASSTEDSK
jgi:hypothetical protein